VGDLERARQFALSLPGTSEEPHFDMTSFRVRGKIFATVPPGQCYLHAFVDEPEVHACVAENPGAFALLRWGQRISGLRIDLAAAPAERIEELLEESWRRKAPKGLIAQLEQRRRHPGTSPGAR
jgi:hypothetical protein